MLRIFLCLGMTLTIPSGTALAQPEDVTARALAQSVTSRPPTSGELADILEAIRVGTESRGSFTVYHMRVLAGGADAVAYADVQSADSGGNQSLSGWAFLERRAGRWMFLVGIDYSNFSPCRLQVLAVTNALARYELASLRLNANGDDEIFNLRFYSFVRRALGAPEERRCVGNVLFTDRSGRLLRSTGAPSGE